MFQFNRDPIQMQELSWQKISNSFHGVGSNDNIPIYGGQSGTKRIQTRLLLTTTELLTLTLQYGRKDEMDC